MHGGRMGARMGARIVLAASLVLHRRRGAPHFKRIETFLPARGDRREATLRHHRRDKALRGAGRRAHRERERAREGGKGEKGEAKQERKTRERKELRHRRIVEKREAPSRGSRGDVREEEKFLTLKGRSAVRRGRGRERQRFITGIERSLCHGEKERERGEGDSGGDCGRDPRCCIGS